MFVYRALLTALAPALAGAALYRAVTGREDLEALSDRLTGPPAAPGAIWLHGASNGELASARALLDRLMEADPRRQFLVTANTLTGREAARGWSDPRIRARIAPFDLRLSLVRPLRHVSALILVESELWPNRIAGAAARGLPVILAGARLSERSHARWQRRLPLARAMMDRLTLVAPQDALSAERFHDLGLAHDRLLPPVQLKSLYRPHITPPDPVLAAAFPKDSTLLAASTHAPEEETALDAFLLARARRSDLRLIIAPRHPRRAGEILALAGARGLPVARRSAGDPPDRPVYLADTMGEMATWYRLAGAAFVGGSLSGHGGHTPYEPAAHGCAILHGPDTANFADAYERLGHDGAARVTDAESLAREWLAHVAGSPLPDRARAVLHPEDAGEVLDAIDRALRPRR
ncbi:3-deoxy-D-manno-octulosonic acid transferase [Histidinibacterium lentulum]|nr:glycosyltransferase N-terminal domain-containing protein [Histidinibacterium lentulum]